MIFLKRNINSFYKPLERAKISLSNLKSSMSLNDLFKSKENSYSTSIPRVKISINKYEKIKKNFTNKSIPKKFKKQNSMDDLINNQLKEHIKYSNFLKKQLKKNNDINQERINHYEKLNKKFNEINIQNKVINQQLFDFQEENKRLKVENENLKSKLKDINSNINLNYEYNLKSILEKYEMLKEKKKFYKKMNKNLEKSKKEYEMLIDKLQKSLNLINLSSKDNNLLKISNECYQQNIQKFKDNKDKYIKSRNSFTQNYRNNIDNIIMKQNISENDFDINEKFNNTNFNKKNKDLYNDNLNDNIIIKNSSKNNCSKLLNEKNNEKEKKINNNKFDEIEDLKKNNLNNEKNLIKSPKFKISSKNQFSKSSNHSPQNKDKSNSEKKDLTKKTSPSFLKILKDISNLKDKNITLNLRNNKNLINKNNFKSSSPLNSKKKNLSEEKEDYNLRVNELISLIKEKGNEIELIKEQFKILNFQLLKNYEKINYKEKYKREKIKNNKVNLSLEQLNGLTQELLDTRVEMQNKYENEIKRLKKKINENPNLSPEKDNNYFFSNEKKEYIFINNKFDNLKAIEKKYNFMEIYNDEELKQEKTSQLTLKSNKWEDPFNVDKNVIYLTSDLKTNKNFYMRKKNN